MIRVKRVYDALESNDGARFLVDRLWPRGKKREELGIAGWYKEAAPSNELRRWFAHNPDRWQEFKHRYYDELDDKPATWQPLLEQAHGQNVTLLYGARDREGNNAVALQAYLEEKLHQSSRVTDLRTNGP
jgi:uncharacterized protein YeaO (DUF488 family)